MRSEHKEELKSSMNVEGAPDKENLIGELLEREQVGSSPLWIMGNKVDGYFLALGRQRLSDVKETKEEVKELMVSDMWQIMGNYVLTLIELREKSLNYEKEVVERGIDIAEVEKNV